MISVYLALANYAVCLGYTVMVIFLHRVRSPLSLNFDAVMCIRRML